MFRFLACVWDETNTAAAVAARSIAQRLDERSTWTVALSAQGLQVHHSAPTHASGAHQLDGLCGVVLGTLFSRSPGGASIRAPAMLTAADTRDIVSSRARSLVRRYWGRYVAFVRDPSTGMRWILRDPTGALPCFTAEFRGVTVYFCDLEDYFQLKLHAGAISVNWASIGQGLCQPGGPRTHVTGLSDVLRVLPGECEEWGPSLHGKRLYWNPGLVAADVIEDPARATVLLRESALDGVQALAGCHDSIVLAIGGLDSSIVLACIKLGHRRPRVTCLNYYSPGIRSDERNYVQEMADRFECELMIQPRNPQLSLEPLRRVRAAPNADNYLYFLEASPVEGALASRVSATAIASGFGGDQLFGRTAPFATLDYLSRNTCPFLLPKIAYDQALRERDSVWRILRRALVARVNGRIWNPCRQVGAYRPLLRPEVIESVKHGGLAVSPFLTQAMRDSVQSRVPNGKLDHLEQMLVSPPFHNPLSPEGGPEQWALLFCQPLIETCLRIPTDILTHGGWDRAIARSAFRGDLPRSVVNRRAKGGFSAHTKDVLLGNLPFARGLLLDGNLVKQGILDAAGLERELRPDAIDARGNAAEILEYISTEAMICRWKDLSR